MRKNQMIMLEEFRRRKNLEHYYDMTNDLKRNQAIANNKDPYSMPHDLDERTIEAVDDYQGSNVERFLEPRAEECFDPKQFTLIFLDSDSVTNVTSLSRTNQRRVLIFVGNGNGMVAYGKGKAEEYEQAFENAFKNARANMLCLDINEVQTSPRMLSGRHNDFKIKIYPQKLPNYWGNPTIWEMLKHTGFFHCRFVCVSRKRDPYSLVYGFFNAIVRTKTPEQISQLTGVKLHRIAHVVPTTNSKHFKGVLNS